jgi:hypothetical protein
MDLLGVLRVIHCDMGDRDVGESAAAELGNCRVPERRDFDRVRTLAQLAEQLSALGEIHGKLILPVHVRVAAAPR